MEKYELSSSTHRVRHSPPLPIPVGLCDCLAVYIPLIIPTARQNLALVSSKCIRRGRGILIAEVWDWMHLYPSLQMFGQLEKTPSHGV